MASMLSTCTLLEGLTLDACNVVSNLIVTGPPSLRLKKLKVRYCSATKIEISAANLIAFDFSGDITRISSFSAPRLLEVRFNTGTKASTFAHGLAQFASHPCLENLSLIMYSSTVKEIPQSIPLFKNLKELNMNIWNSSCGSEEDELLWVLFILKATPLLQKLELTVCAQDFFENQLEIRSFSGFSHDQLRQIEMHGFVGNWYEVEFAIYMLESLKILELMVIDPSTRCYRNGMWANYVDSSWEEKHKPIVQDKLEKVKTSAQLRIL
ncbi:uncharacterized protein LOC115956930 [Quercus lobata]|uniref:uncharacterized protein LOC115956930 n=1 Tax=Quercus lobata TaxID=97700 RepID=UPI001244A1C6|nr:uncharacterized protein LOC115956930 [Quercus lobata]